MQARGFIRGGALIITRGQVLRGFTAIVDPEWDDWHAPQLTTATCWEQFEGEGRNDFGCQIIEARKEIKRAVAVRYPPPPPLPTAVPRPWHNVPQLEPMIGAMPQSFLESPESPFFAQPAPAVFKTRPWIRPEPVRPELPKDAKPLHPFCYGCGWRQGGPDSWDGATCKCGTRGEPLIGPNGGFFYGPRMA
jgi:hypothetical protein